VLSITNTVIGFVDLRWSRLAFTQASVFSMIPSGWPQAGWLQREAQGRGRGAGIDLLDHPAAMVGLVVYSNGEPIGLTPREFRWAGPAA
jgi:hypothetical protein